MQTKPISRLALGVMLVLGATQAGGQTYVNLVQGQGALVAGDFNRDGRPDLAVANRDSNSVSVLMGNGNGTFQTALTLGLNRKPYFLAAGDFNGDGKPDLVSRNEDDLSLWPGNGDGTFQSPRNINLPMRHHLLSAAYGWVAGAMAGDFNHDGRMDLAFTSRDRNDDYVLNVYLGQTDGTFDAKSTTTLYTFAPSTEALVVGDFDGDGNLDARTAGVFGGFDGTPPMAMNLVRGKGDGTMFAPVLTRVYGGTPAVLVAADCSSDGLLDFVVNATIWSTNAAYLGTALNTGTTNFQTLPIEVENRPHALAIADFNRDNRPDLLTLIHSDTNVGVLLGNGDGTFQASQSFPTGLSIPLVVAVADFNGDGFPDAAIAGPTSANIAVLTNLNILAMPQFDAAFSVHSGGAFRGRLLGPPGQRQLIERSSDFVSWVAIATNSAGVTPFNFTNTTALPRAFYRARVIP